VVWSFTIFAGGVVGGECWDDGERSEDSKCTAVDVVPVVVYWENFAREEAEVEVLAYFVANEGVAWVVVDGYDGPALVVKNGVAGDVVAFFRAFGFASWNGEFRYDGVSVPW